MPPFATISAARITRAVVSITLGLVALAGASLVTSPPAVAAACSFPAPNPLPSTDGLIQDAADLQWLRDTSSAWSGSWTQTANIDMGGCDWTSPIGTSGSNFTGTYDGSGFVISGLSITMTGDDAGLFGVASVTSIIRNVGFTGDVSGDGDVGGLVGELDGGSILSSYTTGAVTGTADVGGLVGQFDGGSILDSYATGGVNSTIDDAGGLVGQMSAGSIARSYATGDVTTPEYGGGLVAYMVGYGEVIDSFASGNVTGDSDLAGLVAYAPAGARIARSFASGNITGTGNYLGGLIGYFVAGNCLAPNGVSDSFATGNVTGNAASSQYVGGLIARNLGCDVINAYSVGQVTGNQDVGGLIGLNTGVVSNSFWNTDTGGGSSDGGTGKTTAEMKALSTFVDAGWDITESCFASSIWGICSDVNSGYPYLSALSALTPSVSSQAREVDFTFFLPDGRECTSISPMRVPVGSSVQLPGVDADCRTMPGASVGGWTIPVAPSFTGAGSASEPFNPGHWVEVSDSQRFTVVPLEPVLSFTYDANVGEGVECAATDVSHVSADGREMSVWVPRVDVPMARFPDRASCVPAGHVLIGWNTRGDGSGETYELGVELPAGWEQDPTNRRVLFAVWEAA